MRHYKQIAWCWGIHTMYTLYLHGVGGYTQSMHSTCMVLGLHSTCMVLGYTQNTHSTCSNHLHKTMQQLAVNVTCTFPRICLTDFDLNRMYCILFGLTFDDHQVLFEASASFIRWCLINLYSEGFTCPTTVWTWKPKVDIKFIHKEVVIEMLRDQRLPNFLWSCMINSSFLVLLLYCNKLWIMLL